MNVLYIANKGEVGGATKSLLNMISSLKNKEINPIVLTPVKNGVVMQYCKKNNIPVHYTNYYMIAYVSSKSTKKNFVKIILAFFLSIFTYIINKMAVKKISQIINMNSIDIIHTNLNRDEIGLMLAKKYNKLHIVHLREYGTLDFNCKYIRPKYYEYLNKHTTKFIAISKSIKDFYIEKGITESKIDVIYNGVQSNVVSKEYSKQTNKENINIVILSGISEEKGQIQVINALEKLQKNTNKKIKLYLYGNCSKDYMKYLKIQLEEKKLANQVHFLGYRNNVYEELAKYDIAITPSKSEAFGRVTVEYMLAKLPVIVSNTGANPEIIINNKCGLIYKYSDINDLTKQIIKLINSFDLRKKYGEEGYKRAKESFTSEINAINIKKLYIKLNRGQNETLHN